MKINTLKNIGAIFCVISFSLTQVSASFMFQKIDPICSISGTTHTSFPGEISDTSSWNIPTAYEGECDVTPELSESEKEKIFQIMDTFFERNNFYGELYSDVANIKSENLNQDGQDFVNKIFFPAIKFYIDTERTKTSANMKNIAVLNYVVKIIGYDYYISK